MELTEPLLELLRAPSICYVSTLMPDGTPQLTQTWVDTDGEHVLINTPSGTQKLRNLARDPRVTLAVEDRDQPFRYVEVRGHVVDTTTEGGKDHIEALSQRYLGRPYPNFGGHSGDRVIIRIAADRIRGMD